MDQQPEWLSSNLSINYPFQEAVPNPAGFETLFADAYVLHGQAVEKAVEIASIKIVTVPLSSSEIRVQFIDGTVILDTAAGATCEGLEFGDWYVLEWKDFSPFEEDNIAFVKILVDKTKVSTFFTGPTVTPTDAIFTSRVTQKRPSRVNTIKRSGAPSAASGDVELVEGYNVAIGIGGSSGLTAFVEPILDDLRTGGDVRPTTRLIFDAIAGAGRGQFVGCGSVDRVLRTLNGVGPNEHGDFALDPRDCYWMELPVTGTTGGSGAGWDQVVSIDENTIKLNNDCEPCCSCQDYVNVYRFMKRLWRMAQEAAAHVERARQEYNDLVETLKKEKACREGLGLEIKVSSRPDWIVPVQALVTNNQACNVGPTEVIFEFEGPTSAIIVPGSAYMDADYSKHTEVEFTGAYPTIRSVYNDPIVGSRWLRIFFEIYVMEGTGRFDGAPMNVKITAKVKDHDGTEVVLEQNDNVTLYRPLQKS